MRKRVVGLLVWVVRVAAAGNIAGIVALGCFFGYLRVRCGRLFWDSRQVESLGSAIDQIMHMDAVCLNVPSQPVSVLRYAVSLGVGLLFGAFALVMLVRRGLPKVVS